MKNKNTFATVINCMDGRTQKPAFDYITKKYKVSYPDTITEAGPVKILAEGEQKDKIESIQERVGISINKHHSKLIFVVAHYDCAGNPVKKEKQLKQLKKSMKTIQKWNYNVDKIIGLWVGKSWKVKKVYEI